MIGSLRRRIEIQVWSSVPDGAGGFTESWTLEANTWASLIPKKSSRFLQDSQVQLNEAWTGIVRWSNERLMDKKRRIIYNGQTLTITSAYIIDERRYYWQVQCLANG